MVVQGFTGFVLGEVSYLQETAFQKFAQTLAAYFQGEKSPEKFTREMFDHIYANLEDDNPLDDVSERSYRGYFYGENDITALAKKIAKELDTVLFPPFVETEYDETIEDICKVFKDECPDINSENYGKKLGERLKEIIIQAATPKRKRKKSPLAVIKADEDSKEIAVLSSTSPLKEKYGVLLIAEEGSVCPCDGCSKPLFMNVNGHLGLNFDVTVIDPQQPENNTNNLMAMCPECCARYSIGRTPETMHRLQEIKNHLIDLTDARELVATQKIEEGVRRVLEKIPTISKPKDVDLNYDPVALRQKIEAENLLLYVRTQAQVNIYFNAVHEIFQQLSKEGKLRFKPFCNQVKITYLNLKDKGYDQQQIFDKMVDWLQTSTNEERGSCEVIISYFIQKCEVFDVITE